MKDGNSDLRFQRERGGGRTGEGTEDFSLLVRLQHCVTHPLTKDNLHGYPGGGVSDLPLSNYYEPELSNIMFWYIIWSPVVFLSNGY